MINKAIRENGAVYYNAKGNTKVSRQLAERLFNYLGDTSWSDDVYTDGNNWELSMIFTSELRDADIELLKTYFKGRRGVKVEITTIDTDDTVIEL